MREWLRGISLALTAFGLGYTSGMEWLGFVACLAFLAVVTLNKFVRTDARKRPLYHKWLAYAGIVPCAIWWLVTPAVDYGVSPYLVYIPGWYLLFLSFLQLRSIGRGGYEVFVAFDGVAALLASTYQAPRFVVLAALAALLLWVFSFVRRGVPVYKLLLFVLLFAMLTGASAVGYRYWKAHRYSHMGKAAHEYYLKNRVMGFSPVAALGSFRSNYESRYNKEVVLRIWDTLAPRYIKAAAYEKYVAGIWKLPSRSVNTLYPSRYQVDYAVFEIGDSLASVGKLDSGLKRVWVQSSMDNFKFLFAANDAVGLAVKNEDSLNYFADGFFTGYEKRHSDWYYFIDDSSSSWQTGGVPGNDSLRNLQISAKYVDFLDSIVENVGLARDSLLDADSLFAKISSYFVLNFRYSLVVPGVRPSRGSTKTEPLRAFWKSKQGYCEYYATLATLLLRKMGVPARYVTGFVGGERRTGRPYVVFRRYNAHAWVEVLVNGRWIPFDPTPPIMMFPAMETSLLDRTVETIRGKWARIMHLLRDGEWRQVVDSWQNTTNVLISGPYLYVLVCGLLIVLFLRKFVRTRRKKEWLDSASHANHVTRWSRLLAQAERKLARNGFVRKNGETVGAFISRIEGCADFGKSKLLVEKLKDYESHRWK